MSRVPNEPQSWSPPDEADEVLGELRAQLDRVKARMAEHWEAMEAVGLTRPKRGNSEESA